MSVGSITSSEQGGSVSTTARKSLWSDLNLAFVVHPILMDLRPVTDAEAVKNSVRNLVCTSYFERPFHPEIGSNIGKLLFENVNVFTAISIRQEIENLLGEQEPRVTDVVVKVSDDSDRNAYQVTIGYRITQKPEMQTQSLSFYLSRLR